jgi:Holliday junction resolvase RusA-like endonuclease
MVITLPKPPSVNILYTRNFHNPNIRILSDKGRAWFEEAGWKLKSQWKGKTLLGNVALYIKYYFCGSWDWDNGNKALSDLFTKMRVYKDDKQVNFAQIQTIRVKHRELQKVEIEIVE